MTILMAISFLLVLSTILVVRVFFKEYPGSVVDVSRNRLFELRDQLFELAKEGHIKFDSPAYAKHRSLLNGMIRYAHDISVSQFLLSELLWRSERSKQYSKLVNSQLRQSLVGLSPEAQQRMDEIMQGAMICLFELMLSKSVVVATIVYPPLLAFSACKKVFNQAKQLAPRVFSSRRISVVDAAVADFINVRQMKPVRSRINAEAARYIPESVGVPA